MADRRDKGEEKMKRMLLLPLILCSCGSASGKSGFDQCWRILREGLWSESSPSFKEEVEGLSAMDPGSYDAKWSFEAYVSFDGAPYHPMPIVSAANFSSGDISFCIAWSEGEIAFVWAR